MKCQRQILSIRWQDRVQNIEITNQTGLPPVMEHVVKRRNSIFGHIARMPHAVSAHQADTGSRCRDMYPSRRRCPDPRKLPHESRVITRQLPLSSRVITRPTTLLSCLPILQPDGLRYLPALMRLLRRWVYTPHGQRRSYRT